MLNEKWFQSCIYFNPIFWWKFLRCGFKGAHLTKYLIVDILWTWCLESNGFSGSTQFSLTHQAIFTRLIWKLASLLHATWTTKTQQCNILHGLMYEDEILYVGNEFLTFVTGKLWTWSLNVNTILKFWLSICSWFSGEATQRLHCSDAGGGLICGEWELGTKPTVERTWTYKLYVSLLFL